MCKNQIWVLGPKDEWTSVQRAQNNKFVENELENWALMNQTNVEVDLDDKWMKLQVYVEENHPRHCPRRSVLIYFFQVWLQS